MSCRTNLPNQTGSFAGHLLASSLAAPSTSSIKAVIDEAENLLATTRNITPGGIQYQYRVSDGTAASSAITYASDSMEANPPMSKGTALPKPKKPSTAYMFFVKANRKIVFEENNEEMKPTEVRCCFAVSVLCTEHCALPGY